MAYMETSEDWQDYGLFEARIKYAAFLYDEYRKRPDIPDGRAVAFASRKAGVAAQVLRQYLPAHNSERRKLRNLRIIDMRASGFSISLISECLHVNKSTVRRVLNAHAARVATARRYDAYKIRGRLKFGDPRLKTDTMRY